MTQPPRRVVTGHDAAGKSIVLSDGPPAQHHLMHGSAIGADFFEMWNVATAVPQLTATEAREPNERDFTIMPVAGHLLRVIDIYPPKHGGRRTEELARLAFFHIDARFSDELLGQLPQPLELLR